MMATVTQLQNYLITIFAQQKKPSKNYAIGRTPKIYISYWFVGCRKYIEEKLALKKELKSLGLPDKKICLAVFHPEKDFREISYFVSEIINILINNTNLIIVATGSNIDRFGIQIETTIKSLAAEFSDRLSSLIILAQQNI